MPDSIGRHERTPTAWDPDGYEQVAIDVEAAIGDRFYVPGAARAGGNIDARQVSPRVVIYRRKGPAGQRARECEHIASTRGWAHKRRVPRPGLKWHGQSKAWTGRQGLSS